MRNLTLTLILVLSFCMTLPASAQEDMASPGMSIFSTWLEHVDGFLSDLFSQQADEKTQDGSNANGSSDDGSVEPPTTEIGPLLEPHG